MEIEGYGLEEASEERREEMIAVMDSFMHKHI
eukprot:COSAG05_NODE_21898_length_268_cov_0.917160_1_plen_31_part_10